MIRQEELQRTCWLLKAMGDATRLQIVAMLFSGPMDACRITAILHQDEDRVAGHLFALEESGVVTAERNGPRIEYALHSEMRIPRCRSSHDQGIKIGAGVLEFPPVHIDTSPTTS